MGSDEKTRKRRTTDTTGTTIGKKTFSSKKCGFPRQAPPFENIQRQRLFKLFHTVKTNGNFGEASGQ
jgi:hypothetical protein